MNLKSGLIREVVCGSGLIREVNLKSGLIREVDLWEWPYKRGTTV